MIANITKGADFGGLARYLFQVRDQSGEVRPEVVYLGGSVPGRDPPGLAASMDAIAALRPTVTKPVRHWMLRFAPEDAGKYSQDSMRTIGERFAQEMGASAFALVSHGDHVHIMANAVTHDGGYVPDTWDYAKAQTVVRGIERDYGLREIRSTHEVEPDPEGGKPRVVTVSPPEDARPKRGELNAAVAGQESHRLTLQALVGAAAKGAATLTQFVERLEVVGVSPRVMVNKTGWTGVSFSYQGTAFKGQDLGNKYKARELQKAGVSYVEDRDREAVERCRRRAEDRGDASVDGHVAGATPSNGSVAREAGHDANRDPGTNGASRGAASGEHGSPLRPDAHVPVAGDGRGRRDVQAGGAGEQNGRGLDPDDGREREDASPGAGTPARADAGTRQGQLGAPGAGPEAMADPDGIVARLVARDGAYSRVLGLAAADLLAESAGGSGVGEGVQRGQRAGLQRVAVGAFSAVAAGRIRQQVAAMSVDRVEIGILPPKDRDDLRVLPFRQWTAAEACDPKRVAYLAAMNSQGYDIYVRPDRAQGDNKGLVLLDDLDAGKVARLTADGFEPSVVVETSPGNLQAWVRVSADPLTAEEGTAIAKALTERYGADPGAADWCHFGRLAPFANRKAKHADPTTKQGPLTELKRAVAVVANRGAELVTHVRQWLSDRAAEARAQEAARAARGAQDHARWQQMDRAERAQASPADAFIAFRGAVQTARPDDESARDYGAALRMFAAGYDAGQVVQAMRDGSPGLAERKGRGRDGYVDRTVKRAEEETFRRGWKM